MYSQFRWSLFSISGENLVEITGLEERPAILSKKPGDRGGGEFNKFHNKLKLDFPKNRISLRAQQLVSAKKKNEVRG